MRRSEWVSCDAVNAPAAKMPKAHAKRMAINSAMRKPFIASLRMQSIAPVTARNHSRQFVRGSDCWQVSKIDLSADDPHPIRQLLSLTGTCFQIHSAALSIIWMKSVLGFTHPARLPFAAVPGRAIFHVSRCPSYSSICLKRSMLIIFVLQKKNPQPNRYELSDAGLISRPWPAV